MKKHLRGRRYIRSRASVRIGRFNKQIRGIDRGIEAIKRFAEALKRIDFTDLARAFQEIILNEVRFVDYKITSLREQHETHD